MQEFARSVADVLECLDLLEILGFDNKTSTSVQNADSTASAVSDTIEDITIARACLNATECFLRRPTLENYLAFMNAIRWFPESEKWMLAEFERFLMARGACSAEPASSEIGTVVPVILDRLNYGAALALGGDHAAAG
jgi:hypothetical protein